MERVPYYRKVLLNALAEKSSKNPKYSLRAFSKFLGMNSSTVSQIINGKRMLSEKMAHKIFLKLQMPTDSKEEFLLSVSITKMKLGHRRFSKELKKKVKDEIERERYELSHENFKVISHWYHYAIMALTDTEEFEPSAKWISKQLNISEAQAEEAVSRLLELGLLKIADDTLVVTRKQVDTKDKSVTGPALKLRQKQILEKSIHSLEHDPLEIRNHSAMTMVIDPHKLPEAKKRIQKFLQDMSLFLESGRSKKVYELAINLFPLQNMENQ
jgi:uncharacterized protein (TIGR02147 family)